MYKIQILEDSRLSKIQQIVSNLAGDIEKGKLKNEYKLPSITCFSKINHVARDTVEKAYKLLRKQGYITSSPGRGYYVVGKRRGKLKMLLIADKNNSFNVVKYRNLKDSLDIKDEGELEIDFCCPEALSELSDASLKNYDFYIIRPDMYFDVLGTQ